ncbi:MAG: hypothetical protein GXO23_01800 [Crenarchaeota archaeon]|nr:hypothetical protein [Thermoproteota archaeon]
MRLVIIHVEDEVCRRGRILKMFAIPYKSFHDMTYLDILTLGNLKLLKTYDFWINVEEFPHRVENMSAEEPMDVLDKVVEVRSIGGRLISLRIVGSYDTYRISELSSRPVGIRIIGERASIAFSETLYVSAPCRDPYLDARFIRGEVERLLIGASVKNFLKSLDLLREASERGMLARRKLVLFADFVREFSISV